MRSWKSKTLFNVTHNLESANDRTKHWSFLTVRSSLQLGDITFKEEGNIKALQKIKKISENCKSVPDYRNTVINEFIIRTENIESSLTFNLKHLICLQHLFQFNSQFTANTKTTNCSKYFPTATIQHLQSGCVYILKKIFSCSLMF